MHVNPGLEGAAAGVANRGGPRREARDRRLSESHPRHNEAWPQDRSRRRDYVQTLAGTEILAIDSTLVQMGRFIQPQRKQEILQNEKQGGKSRGCHSAFKLRIESDDGGVKSAYARTRTTNVRPWRLELEEAPEAFRWQCKVPRLPSVIIWLGSDCGPEKIRRGDGFAGKGDNVGQQRFKLSPGFGEHGEVMTLANDWLLCSRTILKVNACV